MHVYTEHGITNLLTYSIHANGPRKVIIEEITEAVDMNEPSSSNTSQMPERQKCPVCIVENGEVDLGYVNSKSIIMLPEYNTQRVWQHNNPISSCSTKLNMDPKIGIR